MHKYCLLIGLLVVAPKLLPAQFDTIFSLNKTSSHFIKEDTIWLTARGGVTKRLCSTGEILKTYTHANAPIPIFQWVSSVFVDKQNRMWLYLEEKGIAMLNDAVWTYWSQDDAYWVLSASSGGRIVVDDDNIPWIVSAGRSPMYYINGQWQIPPNSNFGAFSPTEMKIGSDGKMWAANDYGGLYRYNGTDWEAIVQPSTTVATFAMAPGGGFYTCQNFPNDSSGVFYYPGVGQDNIPIGTLDGLSRRMTVAPSGRIWVAGDFPAGIAYYENNQWQYLSDDNDGARPFTLSVDDQGRLWNTRDFYGTEMYDGSQWQPIWSGPIGFERGTKGKDGTVWFGYFNTLSHYYPATGLTEYVYLKPSDKLYDSNMVGLEAGPNGTFYAANQLGHLAWYDGNGTIKKTMETSGLSHAWNSFVAMSVDPFDNLYYHGWDVFSDLIRYNARTGQHNILVKNHSTDPAIPFSEYWAFDTDRRGRLWINTEKGLVSWQNNGWKTYYEPSPALNYLEYMKAGVNGVWQYSSIGQTLQYFDGKDTASWSMPLDTTAGEQMNNLYSDSRNWLWCRTNKNRLLCLQGYNWKIYDPAMGTFPDLGIGNMFEDDAGNMWFMNGELAIRLSIPSGRISGQLLEDKNLDCSIQTGEPGVGGYRLVFDDGQNRVETLADKSGNFSVAIPPGTYTASVIPFNNLGKSCQSGFSVNILENVTSWLQMPVQTILYTPLMSVRIGTAFTRRCSETSYYVNVCNEGNLATEAIVTVQLPPGLSFVGSNMPNFVDSTGLVTFTLGQLDFSTCIDFSFAAKVGCNETAELGQSLCVTAHVSPDTLPGIGNYAWNGASMVVKGRCTGSEVVFEVKNEGKSKSQSPLNYQVIKDEYLLEQGTLSLFKQESKEFEYPADGSTLRFSIEQESGHPAPSATIAVEACGTPGSGQQRSTGFMTQTDNNTGNPFEYTDCHDVIGSYDPNDKESQPKGWGDDHQIAPGQLLHYNIRFQNTGTDTAFLVVLRDTLDAALDLNSLRPELSSHPYHLELNNADRALAFVFDNILLPDSTHNESGSHGFVQFSIRPKPDVSLGTVIHNDASIYFDANAAVLTKVVQHKVDTGFIRLKPPVDTPKHEVFFKPNPSKHNTWVSIDFFNTEQNYLLQIYDAKGSLVRSITMSQSPFLLEKGSLPAGVYQVGVWEDGIFMIAGQVVFSD